MAFLMLHHLVPWFLMLYINHNMLMTKFGISHRYIKDLIEPIPSHQE
jgi:hypothetical protein